MRGQCERSVITCTSLGSLRWACVRPATSSWSPAFAESSGRDIFSMMMMITEVSTGMIISWMTGVSMMIYLEEGGFPGGIENGRASEVTKGHFFIPVIAHNMKGYDSHIILKHLTKQFPDEQIQVIANNQEKYIAFDMGPFRFIDSLQFLGCSLDTLVSNLSRDGTSKFNLTRRFYRDDEKTLEILTRKGVYPYEFVTDRTKMAETCLPPKEKFYSHLSESHISDADYEHAKKVWAFFKMGTFHEFHDRYLLTDVLLLADVFQNFRTMSLQNYGLDPLHYYTSPGLSWDSCLKMTGIRLELITDMEQMLFIEKGLRGGTSTITQRHAVANNPLVPNYDPSKESNYIIYLDCNNLYGHSQSQYLPYGGFSFLKQNDGGQFLNHENKIFRPETSAMRMTKLGTCWRWTWNTRSICTMITTTTHSQLKSVLWRRKTFQDYALHLAEKFGIKFNEEPKLIPNFRKKEKYVVHYRNLKFYLEKGLKVTAIHRILQFFQKPWLAKYIEFNTLKRRNAKSSFEKDFWKLMNNSVFGQYSNNQLIFW